MERYEAIMSLLNSIFSSVKYLGIENVTEDTLDVFDCNLDTDTIIRVIVHSDSYNGDTKQCIAYAHPYNAKELTMMPTGFVGYVVISNPKLMLYNDIDFARFVMYHELGHILVDDANPLKSSDIAWREAVADAYSAEHTGYDVAATSLAIMRDDMKNQFPKFKDWFGSKSKFLNLLQFFGAYLIMIGRIQHIEKNRKERK